MGGITFDLFFGATHYLFHKIEYLWQLHKVHHEYKKESLNGFANFYGNFFDNFGMTFPFVPSMVVVLMCGGSLPLYSNIIFNAAFTHFKYPKKFLCNVLFYENEILLDIIFGAKLSSFHQEHHNLNISRYSGFGFLSDHFLKFICDPIVKYIDQKK